MFRTPATFEIVYIMKQGHKYRPLRSMCPNIAATLVLVLPVTRLQEVCSLGYSGLVDIGMATAEPTYVDGLAHLHR